MTTFFARHRAVLLLVAAVTCLHVSAAPAAAARPAPHARIAVSWRSWGCTTAAVHRLHGTRRATRAVRCLINRLRAVDGLRPLRPNRCLARAARRHAHDMVSRRYFAHTSLNGRGPAQRILGTGYIPRAGHWIVGENLAWGMGASGRPRAILRAWLHSPPHRANMLSGRFRDVGVGVARGTPFRMPGEPPTRDTYVVEFGAHSGRTRCDGAPRRPVRHHRRRARAAAPSAQPPPTPVPAPEPSPAPAPAPGPPALSAPPVAPPAS